MLQFKKGKNRKVKYQYLNLSINLHSLPSHSCILSKLGVTDHHYLKQSYQVQNQLIISACKTHALLC